MSQSAVVEQTFALGRYSKRKRTQVTYFMEELEVSDTESEFEGVQVKKRKPATPKPLPKSKIFPFMELPAEVRNMVYTYALSDPSGINLVATIKHRRRTVERISAEVQDYIKDSYRRSGFRCMNDEVRSKSEDPVALNPCLLAVSKQIHQEGRDILYANKFIFTDSVALYSFIVNVGPTGAKYLKTLRLMDWGFGRGMKGYNHACFAVLAWATNLEKLTLDKMPGYARGPKAFAEQLYRDAFPWMEVVGAAKGKVDAALDVLEIPEEAFDYHYYHAGQQRTVSGEENLEKFRIVLQTMLNQQQKRIMTKPSKKRKIAKDEL